MAPQPSLLALMPIVQWCRNWGGARGATGPPIFVRPVKPIRTGEGRLSPPITTGTPKVFHLPASLGTAVAVQLRGKEIGFQNITTFLYFNSKVTKKDAHEAKIHKNVVNCPTELKKSY